MTKTPRPVAKIPRKIGRYDILSSLGEGATSVVYEGYDPEIERRVAIKFLHRHLIHGKVGEELLTRFKREAISAARCIHPNVVTVLEYGQHENTPFIVMEFIDGVSVHRLIKHRRKLGRGVSLRRSLAIMSGLLNALHAAHGLSIIHRDVKASNVLISRKGNQIKLADFGMARITENSDMTMIGTLMGTPRYMAPEIRFGLEADSRADIFSAARLFLELLKMMPDSSPIHRSKIPVIANMPPGNRIDYSAVYPTALIHVVIKGLAVDRDKRYQTVLEFMQGIKQALPNLQQKPATYAGQAAAPIAAQSVRKPSVAQQPEKKLPSIRESVQDTPASIDELESMTNLLADFIGPVAAIIMEEHETKSTSANNLAREISKEIPEQEKQEEFLRRWKSISISRRSFFNQKLPDAVSKNTESRSSQGQVLGRIGKEFAHYVGPIAEKLFRL